jgi:hypothetical protein
MLLSLSAALLAGVHLAGPPVCSLVAYDFQRQDDRSYFVAAPGPDSAMAGMGATRLGMFPEAPRPGAPPRRPVFGQVATLQRLGGRDTAVIEAAFRAAGSREVVLVPWGFDAGCRPAVWTGSSRFAALGHPGFYVARLRERAHWAGPRPTFDVYFAGRYPYPTGSFFRGTPPGTSVMTAAEYFDLYEALPSSRTPMAQRQQAARRLWGWARANPGAASKAPATHVLAEVRRYYGWSEADVERIMSAPGS